MSQVKTNAMRILDGKKVPYKIYNYDSSDGKIDGIAVAEKIGQDALFVYKTLVAEGNSKTIYVFVLPVRDELDLKKAAQVTGEKKIEMLPVKDLQKTTGYIRGGCSPVGMKKKYRTVIDESALQISQIIVSGGRIGVQVELLVNDLVGVTEAETADIIKNSHS